MGFKIAWLNRDSSFFSLFCVLVRDIVAVFGGQTGISSREYQIGWERVNGRLVWMSTITPTETRGRAGLHAISSAGTSVDQAGVAR